MTNNQNERGEPTIRELELALVQTTTILNTIKAIMADEELEFKVSFEMIRIVLKANSEVPPIPRPSAEPTPHDGGQA